MPRGLIGLVGANGAGKTTLFRILLGLSRPDAGTVEVCGVTITPGSATPGPTRRPPGSGASWRTGGPGLTAVRSRLGYMPEHDCLPLDQSAADIVAMLGELSGLPARAARQRASEVLDLVGLDEARFRAVGGFSTGMRQRVKLAQALVADPVLALLDEPTAGLDPTGREEMLALVTRLAGFGISVLLATHLLDDVARVCGHVIMLDAGRLVTAGPTRALLAGTGALTVEVGRGAAELAGVLGRRGLAVRLGEDGTIEVRPPAVPTVAPPAGVAVSDGVPDDALDDALDVIRDSLAELGLPLHRLSSQVASLDEAFVHRPSSPPAPSPPATAVNGRDPRDVGAGPHRQVGP